MTEPGAPKVLGEHRALITGIAQHEPGKQRPATGCHHHRSPEQGAAYGIGGLSDQVAPTDHRQPVDIDPTDQMAAGRPIIAGWPRRDGSTDVDRLARRPLGQDDAGPASSPQVDVMAVRSNLGVNGAGRPLRIGDQRAACHERSGRHRLVTRPRTGAESRRQQAHTDDQQQRPADQQRHRDDDDHGGERHWPRSPRTDRGGCREQHGTQVAELPRAGRRRPDPRRLDAGHPTRTRSRSCASLASPMPRTWARSPTERNGPCRWR